MLPQVGWFAWERTERVPEEKKAVSWVRIVPLPLLLGRRRCSKRMNFWPQSGQSPDQFPRGTVRRMNDHHAKDQLQSQMRVQSRQRMRNEISRALLEVSRRGIRPQLASMCAEFSGHFEPLFCPRLERAARSGETTQSGGSVMNPEQTPGDSVNNPS